MVNKNCPKCGKNNVYIEIYDKKRCPWCGWNIASTPFFGEYTVVTKYITFTGGAEDLPHDPAPAPDVLKVTITHGNQSLTSLFTK